MKVYTQCVIASTVLEREVPVKGTDFSPLSFVGLTDSLGTTHKACYSNHLVQHTGWHVR